MTNYNIYPDYDSRSKIISNLSNRYSFISHSYIGQSLCGRGIDLLHIGNSKNKILFCGGFHGSEYLTILALLKFAEESADSFCNNKNTQKNKIYNLLKTTGLSIVPCVNPDGTEIALHGSKSAKSYSAFVESTSANTQNWQANARGIDINHNFNAGWYALKQRELDMNITKPSPTRFGGPFPESEPETKALTTLCKNNNFKASLALHSQGREIYCSFGNNTPRSSFLLAELASKASGYSIATPEDIATGGGFKDWFIEKFHKPALTVEMGLGKNPLPLSDFEKEYDTLKKIFLAMLTLKSN